MALGGGTFLTQNKVLPGTYITFVSAARALGSIGDRGYAAYPMELDWGLDDEIMTITSGDLQKDSLELFGYDYTNPKLNPLKDLFKGAKIGYIYKLNSGGTKASNRYCTAKHSGVRGNNIKIVISANVDSEGTYDVLTYIDNVKVDEQIAVSAITELTDNAYVTWKKDAQIVLVDTIKADEAVVTESLDLEQTAGMPLTGGTNGTVTGNSHQTFLDKIESYSINTLGCPSSERSIKDLYVQFTKRMRDEVGAKFQCVVHNFSADYEGVINLVSVAKEGETALVPWVTGASAGCAINKSNTNKTYDGEYTIDTNHKQLQLEECVKNGEYVFHKVGDGVNVLTDINSFTSFSVEKNDDFASNQVIRILDQTANDEARIFNSYYLGKTPNNAGGRVALWNEYDNYYKKMQDLEAIEDYNPDELVITRGEGKKDVAIEKAIQPVCTMEKLYVKTIVR